MADHYINITVTVSRERMDALHDARKAAGLSALTDSEMVLRCVQAGEPVELACYADLGQEAV